MSPLVERRIAGSYLRGFELSSLILSACLLALFTWRIADPGAIQGAHAQGELLLASLVFLVIAVYSRRSARLPLSRRRAAWLMVLAGVGHCVWVQLAFRSEVKSVNFMLALISLGIVLPETGHFAAASLLCFGAWAATLARVPLTHTEPWAIAWVTALFLSWAIHLFVRRLLREHQRLSLRDRRLIRDKSRLVEALRDSERKVERLGGLIPICASCKMVRNDQGYWEQVEAFIQTSTGTGLTHGYCPACYETARRELDQLKSETPGAGFTGSGAPGAPRG